MTSNGENRPVYDPNNLRPLQLGHLTPDILHIATTLQRGQIMLRAISGKRGLGAVCDRLRKLNCDTDQPVSGVQRRRIVSLQNNA